ncbi:hypothetical protein Y032_0150g2760 [Ancylostoma ceylanicum]|uniref:Uncharacterized protein n=1 Tax=Ancylostoma ceylanicum TaxID=53326 RepID=A0A016T150_9BILA|nr:hypothetical protein Y032_0150g2760 [Ancylostoma ceylanicum]
MLQSLFVSRESISKVFHMKSLPSAASTCSTIATGSACSPPKRGDKVQETLNGQLDTGAVLRRGCSGCLLRYPTDNALMTLSDTPCPV